MPSSIWRGSLLLIEQPTSPQWVFSDKVTVTRTWKGPYALALSSAALKGTAAVVSGNNMRVVQSTVSKERGGIGTLVISYDNDGQPSQGAQLPLDEVTISVEKQERSLKSHPRYDGVTEAMKGQIDDLVSIKTTDSSYASMRAAVAAVPLGNELYLKLRSGQVSYVFYTPTFKNTLHYWTPPGGLTVGGFRTNPPASTVPLPTGSALGALSWLREGDSVAYNGSTWQVTQAWLAGPDLDTDIYP